MRVAFLGLFFCFIGVASSVRASVVTVLEPTDSVGGKSISAWTGEWYNWAYSFPAALGDPIDDVDGSLASLYQSPPVFQVAGTYGTTVTRSFSVWPNDHLLIPLVNAFTLNFSDPVDVPSSEIDFVQDFINGVDHLFFEVNGVSVGDTAYLKRYFQAETFTYRSSGGNVYGDPAGLWPNYIEGFWIMLEPLEPGNYTFRFGGGNSTAAFDVDVTAHVVVLPEPSTCIVGVILAGSSLCVRRRFGSQRNRQNT